MKGAGVGRHPRARGPRLDRRLVRPRAGGPPRDPRRRPRVLVAIDLLLTPATATTAFPAGLRFPHDGECGIADGRQWSLFAFLANLTGQPAASMPAGRAAAGLPVGLQAIAPRFGDSLLLDVAQALEELLHGVEGGGELGISSWPTRRQCAGAHG
jgi:hypothetical protein